MARPGLGGVSPAGGWGRRYPPLLVMAAALMLAVFALPSALNLPQANPGQTLEYAPVPGDQGQTAAGNFAGLGLGSSNAAPPANGPGGLGDLGGLLGAPPPGQSLPSKFNCVGSPPRQTEDPLSPPCVGSFTSDNGGTTYPGVTRSEVRVLFYLPGGSQDVSSGGDAQVTPSNQYLDLGLPAAGQEDYLARQLRVLQLEFNKRFQTYNRFVHFIIFYDQGTPSAPGNETPEQRTQDAAANYTDKHPFAVVSYVLGSAQVYLAEMARRGVVAFSGSSQVGFGTFGAPDSYFRTYPGRLWSFEPAIEYRAQLFTSMVCREVAGRVVRFSGNVGENGNQRVFGLLTWSESSPVAVPELVLYGKLVQKGIESCGVTFKALGYKAIGSAAALASQAATDMANFNTNKVTTVIDVGISIYQGRAAGAQHYLPEWIIAGDGQADPTTVGGVSDPNVWHNAFLMTTWVRRGPKPLDDPCVQSALDGDSSDNLNDVAYYYCALYSSTRQLFTAIQVAGPRLTPSAIDQGFHAIPRIGTDNSRVPSCFYDPGNYTCVKDAMMEWWDGSGNDPEFASNPDGGGSSTGCWRLIEQGKRSLIGQWPATELFDRKAPTTDPCNGQY